MVLCCGCVLRLCAVAVCCGCVLRLCAVAVWCGCVCVSPPVSKGSTFVTKSFECRGPSPSPVADGQRRGHWGGLQTYLPNCCTSCHSTLSLFVSMVVHATSPKPFPSVSAAVRRSSAAVASLQMRANYLLKHLQLIGLLTLPLSHSFPRGIELTEYNCQSVFRSAVPLGC